MDFNILIGSIQILLSAFEIKLEHFAMLKKKQTPEGLNELYLLDESIRSLEYALSETIKYIGQTSEREPNERISELWKVASNSVRKIQGSADLADITFEKHLYWRNPEFYGTQSNNEIRRISLRNVLNQLQKLRENYESLQRILNK
jgi:hypothetical protein